MDNTCILLMHWEALYPFEPIDQAFSALKLPEEFPKSSLHLALPHDYLVQASKLRESLGMNFGTNDMLNAEPSSFTQSVGARFILETGAVFVLLGKAFNRNQIKESNGAINYKIRAALAADVVPFLCFGETREEFEEGRAGEAIKRQLSECLANFSHEEVQRVHFVYDTPNAISSLSQITAKDLNSAYETCRQQYAVLWGEEVAGHIKTLCALPAYQPIAKEYLENSPFAGFYFRMIDANLSLFSNLAKEIAPFLANTTNVGASQAGSKETNIPPQTSDVPAIIPTQNLTIHEDDIASNVAEKKVVKKTKKASVEDELPDQIKPRRSQKKPPDEEGNVT